ncbi:MAG: prephenate dehydrogenase [Gammaproteobacteria bacterium]
MKPHIKRLTIIGVGLIGGSLARAVRCAGVCGEIVGCGRSRENLQQALELGVIDRMEQDPGRAVQGADLVVVAVPLGAMETVLAQIAPHLAADTVVTDVGSAKASVAAAARRALGERVSRFVPGHPIAGTEQSGVGASFAELFEGRCVILTPLPESDMQAVAQVESLWRSCGARVVAMDIAHHDAVLAATSHLPHLLAYALVDTLAQMDDSEEIFRYAAGGFRDFTRIASSDPVMWRDICLANRAAIVHMLERFAKDLEALTESVRQGDGEQLLALFSRAKSVRDRVIENREQKTED